MKHCLIWFRNDLRVTDNPALHHALKQARLVSALYIDTPEQNRLHQQSELQTDFIRRNLEKLETTLDALNIRLHRETCDYYHQVPEILSRLCTDHKIDAIFANREIPVNECLRDESVASTLEIPFRLFENECIVPPGQVRNGNGDMFRVFTPFSKAWLKCLQLEGYSLHPHPQGSVFVQDDSGEDWPAGETAALKRLGSFCRQRVKHYHNDRDFPALEGTSVLSPYLAAGVISPRQCLSALENQLGHLPLGRGESGFSWLNELIWRDFYRHLMMAYPALSRNQPFKPETLNLKWLDNESHFEAWCAGTTGFPVIDAAMRCLRETGWMHNRLRMICASFLTKDLQIHWRKGEDYFMSQLIDGDLASNNGGWQWAASTGADSVPYFRIFNPVLQSKKFDPEGRFLYRWLPELSKVPVKHVHQPQAWLELNDPDNLYPNPIIDHAEARKQTLQRFQAIKPAPEH